MQKLDLYDSYFKPGYEYERRRTDSFIESHKLTREEEL